MPLEQFGSFSFLWSIILTMTTIGALGGSQFLLREMSYRLTDETRGASQYECLKVIILGPALIFIFIGFMCYILHDFFPWEYIAGREIGLILILAVSYLNNILIHMSNPLRVKGQNSVAMFVHDGLIPMCLLLSAVTSVFLSSFTAITILTIYLVYVLIAIIVVVIYILATINIKSLFSNSGSSGSYSLNYWWNNILGTLSTQIDVLLAGIFLPSASLGVYQILKRFANLLSLVQIVGDWAVAVGLGKAYAVNDISEIKKLCKTGLKVTMIPGGVFMPLCLILFPLVLYVYDITYDAIYMITYLILVLASVINISFGMNFMVANQCHLEKFAVIGRASGVILFLGLVLLLNDNLSIIKIAIISTISMFVTQLIVWKKVKMLLGVDTSFIALIKR